MRTGFFDRVTLCSSCGAPLELAKAAEPVRCGKCGAANQVVVRIDDAISAEWSEDELARLEHLRKQDPSFAPDPAVAPFVAGMRLSLVSAQGAFAAWQALRAQLRPGDVAAERRLTELTLLLGWRAAEDLDPYRERGLLESALTLVRAPRYTQMLRAALSVLAARMGDPAGAEAWLALCDSRAADLRADSYYRFARAYANTAKGELDRVLGVLGGNDVEVPVVAELLGPCALLRANAWERLGRPGAAVDLLVHYKFEADPFGQQIARSFLGMSSKLDLCPRTEPEAERQRQRALGRRRIQWTTGMVVVMGIVVYFLAGALAMLTYGVVALLMLDGEAFGLALLFAFVIVFPVPIFLALFSQAYRRTRRQRALLARGEIAPARLLPGASVISETPGNVDFAARAWVAPDRDPPFEVETTIGSSPERFAELTSGRPFTVRYLGTGILIEPLMR